MSRRYAPGSERGRRFDTFQLIGEGTGLGGRKLTFLMNQAGEIDRLRIALDPAVKEIVFTRKPKPLEKKPTEG